MNAPRLIGELFAFVVRFFELLIDRRSGIQDFRVGEDFHNQAQCQIAREGLLIPPGCGKEDKERTGVHRRAGRRQRAKQVGRNNLEQFRHDGK
ncbi:MAG: hypothetical protein J2P21_01575 [Chloracidobacterium sp.]|nr:hypothetical protein [Chloracidobacterium sp.]